MSQPVPRQLGLSLPHATHHGVEDFLVSRSNELAHERIMAWPDWPERLLAIVGPEGCGKTHLAHIWAAQAGGKLLQAQDLGRIDIGAVPATTALAIEDGDDGTLDERALFHLFNRLREGGGAMLFTARRAPGQWPLSIADLLSRLRLAPVVDIAPPDDALLRALIVKQMVDRQLVVNTGVIDYILARIERSFGAVAHIVETLDREALARKRPITRGLAAEILAARQDDGDSTG